MERPIIPKIYPEGGKVLIQKDTLEEQTESGIIIPNVAKENVEVAGTTGWLLRLGAGASQAIMLQNGERIEIEQKHLPIRVAYARYGGAEVVEDIKADTGLTISKTTYRIMLEGDIIAYLEAPVAEKECCGDCAK